MSDVELDRVPGAHASAVIYSQASRRGAAGRCEVAPWTATLISAGPAGGLSRVPIGRPRPL